MHQKFTLPSGATVLLAPRRDTKAITALILVKIGSRYETKKINGISHFLEHLMFKGTKKRPTAQDISRQLDGLGADYNAFTGKDYTGYYIKAAADNTETCLDILSDIFYNSALDQVEIDRERNVIMEEINMYEDNPMMDIGDVIEGLVFGKNDFLGQPIAGTKQTMRGIHRPQMVDFYTTHYRTDNITIVLAGKMNPTTIRRQIRAYFQEKRTGGKRAAFHPWKKTQRSAQTRFKQRKTEQVHAAVAFPSYSYFDRRRYSQYILATILGGNMSSRLFTEVRERRGLAYFVRAGTNTFEDTGLFYIQAGLDQKRVKEAFGVIGQELFKIQNEPVETQELRRAKDYMKGKLALRMEDSESIADWLGKQQMLTGHIESNEQQVKKIEQVTAGEVQQRARELFTLENLNVAMIAKQDQSHLLATQLAKQLAN